MPLIINADDWGLDELTTDRSLASVRCGSVSSVSAMVFMKDSERGAGLAKEHGVDTGLHLNLTAEFSGPQCSPLLLEHVDRVSRFLSGFRFAPVFYHPGLANSFDYLVKAQLGEYQRLYGVPADRVDGHRHMHLCANVIYRELLPPGTVIRRNLSFRRGEKSCLNRLYRRLCDRKLASRHRLADYFFDLSPLNPSKRLDDIFALAVSFHVEIEAHLIKDDQYTFLTGDEFICSSAHKRVAHGYCVPAPCSPESAVRGA